MSMAEDRYRSDYSRDSGTSQDRPDSRPEPAADPLAELARLIGQSDPFAELKQRRASGYEPQDDVRPAPGWLARGATADEQTDGSYTEPYAAYRAPAQSAEEPAESYDYTQPASAYDHDGHYAPEPQEAYAAEHQGDERYRVAPPAEYEADEYYDDGHLPPRGEDEGVLGGRRRGGLVTIAAVLGLAVIGTAGAFGYRAFTGGPSDSAPPVIKADPNPSKTAPVSPSADATDKPFQDRVGPPGSVQTERIVPREEAPLQQPVQQAPGWPAPQPGAWPATPPRGTAPVQPSAAAPQPGAVPAADTKRVRTVVIKQENTSDTTSTARPTGAPQPAAAPPRATKQNNPAPMAIQPNTPAPEAATPPARVQTSRVPPPAAATDGAYVVQVSAQKTEGEAQASYRSLQQKYPAVLGNQEASIRRADLGDKGVYYRAQIGPFASASAANAFCDNLKAAGGQCIVQKN